MILRDRDIASPFRKFTDFQAPKKKKKKKQ